MKQIIKKYIPVISLIKEDGKILPLAIVWSTKEKETIYKIDRIINIRKAYSLAGGCGYLFECLISGKKSNLFLERKRWFIELEDNINP